MTDAQKKALKTQILSAVRKAHGAQTVSVALAWHKHADVLKAKLAAAN